MGSRSHTTLTSIRVLVLVSYCIAFISATETGNTTTCDAGTFLKHSEDGCLPCPDGTFMPSNNHLFKKCYDCTEIENSDSEILITSCDKFNDADIQCVKGFYRHVPREYYNKPLCMKCRSACPEHYFKVHLCQNFTDLGCCPGENYDYDVLENGLPSCRERPVMCRRGQFLDVNRCKPCSTGTFMSEDYHSNTECWPCQYESEDDLPLHAEFSRPCKSTQPPGIRCKGGFYINHRMSSNKRYVIGCSPCQTCQGMYVGRPCNTYNDTVCCDNANMTVVDGPQGGRCVDVCKYGTYNPPTCDKTCSQECRSSERTDVSPCDHNNGTCLFDCQDGYEGAMCEMEVDNDNCSTTYNNEDKRNAGCEADSSTNTVLWVLLVLALIVVAVVISCFVYHKRCPKSGPQWLQNLVGWICRQNKRKPDKDEEQGQKPDEINIDELGQREAEKQRFIPHEVNPDNENANDEHDEVNPDNENAKDKHVNRDEHPALTHDRLRSGEGDQPTAPTEEPPATDEGQRHGPQVGETNTEENITEDTSATAVEGLPDTSDIVLNTDTDITNQENTSATAVEGLPDTSDIVLNADISNQVPTRASDEPLDTPAEAGRSNHSGDDDLKPALTSEKIRSVRSGNKPGEEQHSGLPGKQTTTGTN